MHHFPNFIFGVFYLDVLWLEKNKGLSRTHISSKFLSRKMKSPRTCEWCRGVYYISVNHLKAICFVGHKISFFHTFVVVVCKFVSFEKLQEFFSFEK